eukprot:UN20977
MTKNEDFLTTTSHRKVVREFFSGTSDIPVSYCSKTCPELSGLSIAPILDRIGRVEAKNDTIEKRWITIPPVPPPR